MLDYKVFAGNSFFYPIKGNIYLCFKTIDKNDKEKYLAGFKKLSSKSIYNRFFGFLKELTDKQVDELLDTDKRDHIAWAAFDFAGEETFGVGVGRFKRSATNPNEAELGLTVIDEYQNKGVGTILLGIMYYLAGKLGIEVFTGLILSDNAKLINRFIELDAQFTRTGNEYEMRLPVYREIDHLPKTEYSGVLKPVLQFLKENDLCP
ncbi:MAG: GNAT family N-acetyltransferase [Cytophagales bacterium]|nr:GNAT family N-acetyltransferase [Cytophagales bacterium]